MRAEEKTGGEGDGGTGGNTGSLSPRPSVPPSPRLINPSCSAVLLAAGRSERMGAFKPLLPFGGRSVVEACVASLRGAGVAEVLVVVGHRAGEVRAALAHLPFVRFAVNAEAGSEMGVSVARRVGGIGGEAGAVVLRVLGQPAVPAAAGRGV